MKNRSLLFSLLFAALLSFTTIIILFIYFLKNDYETQRESMFSRYEIIRSILLNGEQNMSNTEFDRFLRQFDMNIIFNLREKNSILAAASVLERERRKLITQTFLAAPRPFITRKEIELDIVMLEEGKDIYFYLRTPLSDLLIYDATLKPYSYTTGAYPFIIIMLVLFVLFGFILFKLYPLKKISQSIARFGEGDLNVQLDFKGNNELVEIADAFNKSVEQIRSLIQGRTLFMRNIMHELKTPIAKGRLLCGLLESKQDQERFDKVFVRLQKLIDDFALLDQVKSNVDISMSELYNIRDIIDEAVEIGFYEDDEVEISQRDSIKAHVDYNLFVVVVKNLLDNGIKYSVDHKVSVVIEKGKLSFLSKGEPLEKPLDYYLEAFTGDKRKNSFGLGLYIVNAILEKHQMSLSYEHENTYNKFIIDCHCEVAKIS
jgi:two-component system OmpR family sensor kinase